MSVGFIVDGDVQAGKARERRIAKLRVCPASPQCRLQCGDDLELTQRQHDCAVLDHPLQESVVEPSITTLTVGPHQQDP